MDLWIILFLLGLALLGAPLFAIFGAAAMLLFSEMPDTPITGATNDVFSEKFANSPLLVTIPLFTFAGYLMAESGTPRRLVNMSRAWLGWMPGGLAIVCLMASAFFTTFTGGSGITIVAIGGLLYPAMIADRYPERFSLGLVTTGGSLGLLFPPSLPIIIYGVVAGVQIEYLFMAGIIPGVVTLIAIGVYAVFVGVSTKMPRTPFVMKDAMQALWETKWEVLLPVALLGGIMTGTLRIHEAAAFTALYVLIIEVWVYKDVSFRNDLPRIIRESMTLVGAILIILATAVGFTSFLIQARVPFLILDAMSAFIDSKLAFLLLLNVFLLIVGMLMDIFSAIVVVVPLIVPIATRFGVDPVHLGIVFLLNLEIGYMTPPVGLNLFISSFRFNKPVTQLYRAVLPFIALLIIALLITTYGEKLSMWLPERMGYVPSASMHAMEDPDAAPDTGAAHDGSGDSLDDLEGEEPLDLDDLEGEDDEPLNLDDLEGEDGLDDLDDLEGEDGLDDLDDLEDGGTEDLDALEGAP
jgi:C4-dicarboxylate transporter DctM subunit